MSIATGFIDKSMKVDGHERRYVVYVPRGYDPARKWPLVVFLHGAGERGDDGLLQTEVGIGRAIRRWPDRFPCLVVMPQCPTGVWWDGAEDDIDVSLDQTCREYNIDEDRVYLTGLSMGGFGTWIYGALHRDRFAALRPIGGGGDGDDAPALAGIPVWAFHGAQDTVVPIEESRKMVEALRAAGGDVRFTEYPDADHNSWDPAYSDPESIRWLLSQTRRR